MRGRNEKKGARSKTAKVDRADCDWLTVWFCGLNEREKLPTSRRSFPALFSSSFPMFHSGHGSDLTKVRRLDWGYVKWPKNSSARMSFPRPVAMQKAILLILAHSTITQICAWSLNLQACFPSLDWTVNSANARNWEYLSILYTKALIGSVRVGSVRPWP